MVLGTIHDVDVQAAMAQFDENAAYTQLDLLNGCTFTYPGAFGELAGQSLVPGVYCATQFRLSGGTLTLVGLASDTWVFKSASDLVITGGAATGVVSPSCSVWWRVVSTASFDANSSLAGNILADTSITLAAGASLRGKALARTAAVTLSSNTISGCVAACPLVTVNPATLPNGALGAPYSQTITASGGMAPYTFTLSAGALPPGLMLASSGASTALLSGTPTMAGTFTFTVTATDANGCPGIRAYTITINAVVCPTITVSPATLPSTSLGIPYSQTISASGGTPPYTFTVSAGLLPPGLLLTSSGASTALLSGTPTTAGVYNFTISATDANGCPGSQAYTVTISAAGGGGGSIPTLPGWGLMAFIALMAVVSIYFLRRI